MSGDEYAGRNRRKSLRSSVSDDDRLHLTQGTHLHSAYEMTPSLFLSTSWKNSSSFALDTVRPALENAAFSSFLSISPL